jgi:DNA helicase-2/ATP-dependent DNA helicase PcrA
VIEIDNPLESYKEYPGPVLLLASPGTGKTYQLEKRVVYLLDELGASPEEISVITFTTAAARNMRKRLTREDHGLSPDRTPEAITTMHSLGNAIIGRSPAAAGLPPEYGVLTVREHRDVLFQDATTLADADRQAWKLTDDCRRKGACSEDLTLEKCRVCKQYESILRKCALVDYDDQIMLACRLLRTDEGLADEVRKGTKHLLVDEYQDINEAQCEFIQLLTRILPIRLAQQCDRF